MRWRGRYYVGPWMTGHAATGIKVRIRYVPHHDREIEVFDAATNSYLGSAHLADEATAAERAALRRARAAERRREEKALAASARQKRERFAAVTTATLPQPLRAVTAAQAAAELAAVREHDLAARALPDLIPPREPPASWARPLPHPATTAPGAPSPQHPPAAPVAPTSGTPPPTHTTDAEEGTTR